MTKLRRRVFWSAVVLYGVSLPLILAFAFGLHVDSEGSQPVVETATLEVSTTPDGAKVELSGFAARTSPVVFDGLPAGEASIAVTARGALPWRGAVRAEPGLVYSVSQLRMVADAPPREVAAFSASAGPISLEQGRALAYQPVGEDAVVVVELTGETVSVEHVRLAALSGKPAASIAFLELSDQLLVTVSGGGGEAYAMDLGTFAGVRTSRRVLRPVRPLPPGSLVVAASTGDGAVDVLGAEGVVRRSAAGADKPLLDIEGALLAGGFVRGTWYFLDDRGAAYRYGHLLPPERMAELDLSGCDSCRSSGVMRVLLAEDEAVVCLAEASRTAYVVSPRGAVRSIAGVDGGAASEERGRVWLWRGSELLVSHDGKEPVAAARMEGRILRVQEEFAPRHLAVETETGLWLLPAPAAWDERVTFEPLLVASSRPGSRFMACRDGFFAAVEEETGTVRVFRTVWYQG